MGSRGQQRMLFCGLLKTGQGPRPLPTSFREACRAQAKGESCCSIIGLELHRVSGDFSSGLVEKFAVWTTFKFSLGEVSCRCSAFPVQVSREWGSCLLNPTKVERLPCPSFNWWVSLGSSGNCLLFEDEESHRPISPTPRCSPGSSEPCIHMHLRHPLSLWLAGLGYINLLCSSPSSMLR